MTDEKALSVEQLREKRRQLREEVRKTHKKLIKLCNIKYMMEEKYWKQKGQYEKVDLELAMVDGRHRIVTAGQAKVSKEKPVELTQDQLISIAKKLGIEIRVNEPRDNEEEEDD